MRKKSITLSTLGALVLALLIVFSRSYQPSIHASDIIESTVRFVVDGDSLYLENYQPQIRLWGVDAPEKNESGYDQARQQLTQLGLNQKVSCEIVDIDKYDRTVARCFLDNGNEINRLMIESGSAKEYMRFTKGYYSTTKSE